MRKRSAPGMLCLIAGIALFGLTEGLFAGVRQMRAADSLKSNTTNVGTNAYADMDTGYATVNPNYSDGAGNYPAESGDISVTPRNSDASGAVVTGGYYYDYNSWYGNVPEGAMIPIGTILEYPPSTAVPLMVGGSRYYHDSGVYFAEVFDGYAVVYQVVEAPLGAVVTMLPAGCAVQNFNGKSFTVCGNTYYKQVAGGYQVVALTD